MNINDRVKVTLTEYGLEAFHSSYKAMHDTFPDIYEKYVTRTDKVLETQMWDLMNIFGDKCHMGCSQLFIDNEIELLTRTRANPSSAQPQPQKDE